LATTHHKITAANVTWTRAPARWQHSCAHTECSLHQLAPYIGKIKSSIAGELIQRYTSPGDLVADPFAGAGTIPFEAMLRGRRAFAADISPYARILSLAKLSAPRSLNDALHSAEEILIEAAELPEPDLRSVPKCVRCFFHPETLREALKIASVCRRPGNEFVMACLLGILHHQRPGFLSYPSSHLVPYLRDKKYPRSEFPQMYGYREVRPRLLAKVKRSYKRIAAARGAFLGFQATPVQELTLPPRINALITSPPYMNALDYGRDNRLRLWFIDPQLVTEVDNDVTQRHRAFIDAMTKLAQKIDETLVRNGHCVYVVGEEITRTAGVHPSEIVIDIMAESSPSIRLREIVVDAIPDIRRSRRECRGVKTEHILLFEKR
jgi:hypothetical protein